MVLGDGQTPDSDPVCVIVDGVTFDSLSGYGLQVSARAVKSLWGHYFDVSHLLLLRLGSQSGGEQWCFLKLLGLQPGSE